MKPAALLALAGILLAGCKSGYTLTGEIPDLEPSTSAPQRITPPI